MLNRNNAGECWSHFERRARNRAVRVARITVEIKRIGNHSEAGVALCRRRKDNLSEG